MGNWFQGKHTEVGDARALMLDLLGCSKDGRDDGERGWDDLVVEYLGGEYGGGSAPRWPPREPLRTRLVACHWRPINGGETLTRHQNPIAFPPGEKHARASTADFFGSPHAETKTVGSLRSSKMAIAMTRSRSTKQRLAGNSWPLLPPPPPAQRRARATKDKRALRQRRPLPRAFNGEMRFGFPEVVGG
ncbi:hypothetical protein NL676_014159 [Syzygium grande]|nr:hypothetical protein NL676_014159 [Syzygium grande]